MQFVKYPSHENHYRDKFIHQIHEQGHTAAEVKWVISEKLHGSNYAVYTDGVTCKSAKRTGFIEEDQKFFNHDVVDRVLHDQVINLYNELIVPVGLATHTENNLDRPVMIVYGELVGGNIQKGVNYSEEQDFYAFDIAIQGLNENLGILNWLDWDNVILSALDDSGIKYCPVLKYGTFNDVMEVDNMFDSRVNAGTEPFTSEGYVAKPVETRFLHSGSRVSIKSKNETFSEKSAAKTAKKVTPHVPLSDLEELYLNGMPAYININRMHNVMSKEGEFEQKQFGKYMNLLIVDAFEDFCKDNELDLMDMSKQERKRVHSRLMSLARDVVKEYA